MNLDLYRRLAAGATATVSSGRALWRLSGPDAARYLNGQVTNDVAALPEGRAVRAAVCNAKGRMEGDVHIVRRGAEFYLDAEPELREPLGARLEKYLIADDAQFEDLGEVYGWSHVFGAEPPLVAEGFAVPHARYGLPGHDVWTPGTAPYRAGEAVEADLLEVLRVEAGLPRWGAELTPATLPPEAGSAMQAAISYTKGCYVGQEIIARLKSVGHVNRLLVCLRGESSAVPAPGTRLRQEEREVGAVTSAVFSPLAGAALALGYVPYQGAEPGTVYRAGDLAFTIMAAPRPLPI